MNVMGPVLTRASLVTRYALELVRQGLPERTGPMEREVIFILDGVGGFQFVPLLIRRMLQDAGSHLGTIMYRWQFGLPVEIWTDLMWRSRNEKKAAEFAARLADFRAEHPSARIHLVAYSGGCGIAAWACERLTGPAAIETLVLACPALSCTYNLAPALRKVERCYALVSRKDRWILGAGTSVFGTVDRRFACAAGCAGFRRPALLSPEDEAVYDRLWQIEWTAQLRSLGHHGGHAGWATLPFLREHLLALLRGEPRLDASRLTARESHPTVGDTVSTRVDGR